jgi:hypothetical protein
MKFFINYTLLLIYDISSCDISEIIPLSIPLGKYWDNALELAMTNSMPSSTHHL